MPHAHRPRPPATLLPFTSLPCRAAFLKRGGYSPLFGQNWKPLFGLWLSWARCFLECQAPSSRDSSSGWASAWCFKDCFPVLSGTVSSESVSRPCTQMKCCPPAPRSEGDPQGSQPLLSPAPLAILTTGEDSLCLNCTLCPLHATHSPPSSQLSGRGNVSQDKGRLPLLSEIPQSLLIGA